MYYKDLTFYRDEGTGARNVFNVYPNVLNIGWLDVKHSYAKGRVEGELVEKLKNLTFLDVKNGEDRKNGCFDKKKAVVIHLMHMRGSPYKCFLCEENGKEISLDPCGVSVYAGKQKMILGMSEMCIPSLEEGRFYAFPTMLYHYIVEHQYCPPMVFLDALKKFSISSPYDVDKKQEELECFQVPISKLLDLDLQAQS